MRRLVVLACALGLLLVLPVPAATAEVIEVPGTPVFRSANNGPPNCTAYVFIQWPEQEGAEAWELEYEYLRGTGDNLTETKLNLSPPFSDEPTGLAEWAPPSGHHWHYHTYRSKSAPGKSVECESLEDEMLARVISATLRITVPDELEDDALSCSAMEARERRLQRRLKVARKGDRRARSRFTTAKKRVLVANRRLKRARATGPHAAALKAEAARQRALQARQVSRQAVRSTRKATQATQKTLRDFRPGRIEQCPVDQRGP